MSGPSNWPICWLGRSTILGKSVMNLECPLLVHERNLNLIRRNGEMVSSKGQLNPYRDYTRLRSQVGRSRCWRGPLDGLKPLAHLLIRDVVYPEASYRHTQINHIIPRLLYTDWICE